MDFFVELERRGFAPCPTASLKAAEFRLKAFYGSADPYKITEKIGSAEIRGME
jgi:hypothetical protein